VPERLTPADDLDPLVRVLSRGGIAVIPTDTVYGLVTSAHLPDACSRLLALKGRDGSRPAAILCAEVDTLFTTALPELYGRVGVLARRLLPGPVTLVVPNPGGRFRWLCGGRPDRLGVRVPVLEPRVGAAIDRVGVLLATSANLTGGEDPLRVEDVDAALLASVDVVIDGGPTPGGRASTVVDLTGPGPVVLREGPMGADEIAARLAAP
jgi:L-threonylcarbamoyladenylate synthase